ncbi:MAG TPA: redox-regulated ATPase YchF [Dissulfurispiraceae bacterium]|nr:redox-regulated ATPase YchF [Dissulfurispiraceae bacterium]
MKLAIIGLSNSGKTTIFNALTGQNIETTLYATVIGDPHYGIVKVPDTRLERLSEIYKPKKTTHATVEYVDYIGLTKGDLAQNGKVFDLIKDADAVVHVVRAFADEVVTHPLNSVDPLRDIETVELEFVFGDLEFVEKRLARMEEAAKKGKKPNEAEKKLMFKCKEALEKEIPLRNLEFDEEEQKLMKPLQFVSTKPEIIVLNVGEKDLASGRAKELLTDVQKYIADKQIAATTRAVSLCGKIEMEIAQLSADESRAFLDDLGIAEPALDKLIKESYELLGLISFLTAGEDEVRAWTIRKGLAAQQAAGKIHSDIERGFIRAELVSYDDFMADGGMSGARDKGHLRLEGKTYEVKDGDIINFRFNV